MDQHFFVPVVVIAVLCIQCSTGNENAAIRNFISSVGSEVTCEHENRCKMVSTDSYGCHFYRNVNDRSDEPCLIETYKEAVPKIYVKPDTEFKYIEINTYHRLCLPSALGIGNLGSRSLYSEDFNDLDSWHELRVHSHKKHKTYQVFLDEEKKIGKPMTYKSLNKTFIQVLVKGSALWSYECDPRDYQQLLSRATIPWIMFFLLAILLVIMLVCIIVYCSRKLKRQMRRPGDCKSFNVSTRSTISLISSPVISQSSLHGSKDFTNSCGQSLSHQQDTPSTSVAQSCSYTSGSKGVPRDQRWAYTANSNRDNSCKKWVNSHMRFQNNVQIAATNSIQEHIYEDPDEHLYEEADVIPVYENQGEAIYEEIDELKDRIAKANAKRPIVPFNRVDSMGSNFSAANSVYGYR